MRILILLTLLTATTQLASLTSAADTPSSPTHSTPKADTTVIDRVVIGNADSERDHYMWGEQSETGSVANHPWRDAAPDGAFSYVLKLPSGPEEATLICSYWGSDRDRTFEIVVNDLVIATQNLEGLEPDKVIEVAYPLPPELITGEKNLTVCFQGTNQGRVGGLFGLRLESPRP